MKKKLGAILGVALIAVMLVAILASCVPTDPAKAKSNLEAESYETQLLEGIEAQMVTMFLSAVAELDLDAVDSVLTAKKGEDMIVIIYFKEKSDAKAYYEKFDDAITNKLSNEQKEDLGEYGINGVAVYYGSAAAIKAAK